MPPSSFSPCGVAQRTQTRVWRVVRHTEFTSRTHLTTRRTMQYFSLTIRPILPPPRLLPAHAQSPLFCLFVNSGRDQQSHSKCSRTAARNNHAKELAVESIACLILVQVQLFRRLWECLFVTRWGSSRMSLAGYAVSMLVGNRWCWFENSNTRNCTSVYLCCTVEYGTHTGI